MDSSPRTILVIEDSPIDFEAVSRGFRKVGCEDELVNVVDGDEALDYLNKRGKYASNDHSAQPALVLLDLNLPGTDGRGVLREIRANPETKKIPIVALTTSVDPRDVHTCVRARSRWGCRRWPSIFRRGTTAGFAWARGWRREAKRGSPTASSSCSPATSRSPPRSGS